MFCYQWGRLIEHIIVRNIGLILRLLSLKIIWRDFHSNFNFFCPIVFSGSTLCCTNAEIDPLGFRLVLISNLILSSLIVKDRAFGKAQLKLSVSWVRHALNLLSVVVVVLLILSFLLLDVIPLWKILNLILLQLCGLAIALMVLLDLSLRVELVQLLILFVVLLMLQILLLALHLYNSYYWVWISYIFEFFKNVYFFVYLNLINQFSKYYLFKIH